MEQKRKNITKILWFILAACFLVLVGLNALFLEHWLDSDMAAEMMFSKLLSEEGHIFATKSWYYSTEFRLLYTHLIMGPLFRLTSNWHMIRMITNMVFYVLMLWGYFYFTKHLEISETAKVLGAASLLLPFSENIMLHMHMGNTYMAHVIICFFYMGMFLDLASGKRHGKKSEYMIWIFYILLSVACGVSGVRYFLALQAPMALAVLVEVLGGDGFKKLRLSLQDSRLSVKDAWSMLFTRIHLRHLILTLVGSVFAVVGYGINVLYVSRTYQFQTYESTNFIDIYQGVFLERLQNAFGAIVMLFGYIPGKSVLSLRGIISMIAFVLILTIAVLVIKTGKLLKKEMAEAGDLTADVGKTETETVEPVEASAALAVESEKASGTLEESGSATPYFLYLFFCCSFLLNTFVFVCTNSTLVPRYYITTLIFAIPLIGLYFAKCPWKLDRAVAAAVLVVCLVLATAKTTLSMITTDKNADRYPVIAFLQENGFDFGYATYWNGNITQELSNGTIEIANVDFADDNTDAVNFFRWSSAEKYYDADYAKGEVFLLLTTDEAAEYATAPIVKAGKKTYDEKGFVVLAYENNEQFLNYIK